MTLDRPFANTGDKEVFDEASSPTGDMSLEKGFTSLFELTPESGGLFILRQKFNQLMYLITNEILTNKTNIANSVKVTGDQAIDGVKTFTSSPIVPTPTAGDNSNKVASTAFVLANSTIPDASTTVKGKIQIATNAEVQAGTDALKSVTPAGMKAGLNATGPAPIYACRAWVNFNGTGTVAIRASGNVSSITDNGTGDYTVNFSSPMVDTNYSVSGIMAGYSGYTVPTSCAQTLAIGTKATTSQRVYSGQAAGPNNVAWLSIDYPDISVSVFR